MPIRYVGLLKDCYGIFFGARRSTLHVLFTARMFRLQKQVNDVALATGLTEFVRYAQIPELTRSRLSLGGRGLSHDNEGD